MSWTSPCATSVPLPAPTVPVRTPPSSALCWSPRPGLELSIAGFNLFDPGHAEFGGAPARSEIGRRYVVGCHGPCDAALAVLRALAGKRDAAGAGAAMAEPLEYAVKAAYLVKFPNYVEWPVTAFASPTAPLVLCIVGDGPVRQPDRRGGVRPAGAGPSARAAPPEARRCAMPAAMSLTWAATRAPTRRAAPARWS
jgi:hypothetical protein